MRVQKVYYASDKEDMRVRYLILQGEKMLKFINGVYEGEHRVGYDFGIVKEVDIVSILETGLNVEICEQINGVMRKRVIEKEKIEEARKYYERVNRKKYKYVREGEEGGITYRQELYVYMKV